MTDAVPDAAPSAGPPRRTVAATKLALRRAMAEARDAIPEVTRAAAARDLPRHAGVLAVGPADVVSAFWPMRSEIDVRPLMAALADAGATIALPAVAGPRRLVFRLWRQGDPLAPGRFGALEPDAAAEPVAPTLFLVPLLAFTRAGHRLGYGGGFYDVVLSERPPSSRAVGVAFAMQELPAIPVEPHDARLPAVLTEGGLVSCQGPDAVAEAAARPDRKGRTPCD